MKSLWQPRKARAFTLVELLVVIAIIAILAALLLPVLSRGKKRAQRIECISNLKQQGTAFQMFAHDHNGKFPMQVPEAEGGSEEYARGGESNSGLGFFYSYRNFQPLATYLVNPKPLVCPADLIRIPADSFTSLRNSNLSYAIGVRADYNDPSSVLAIDRNITNDLRAYTMVMGLWKDITWTWEMHSFKGNVLFSDSHVEELNTAQLAIPTNTVLFLPTLPPGTGFASGPGPSGSTPQPPALSTGGSPSSGPSPALQQAPPSMAASGAAAKSDSNKPSPKMPMQLGTSTSGANTPGVQGSNRNSAFVENDAKENKRVIATNMPNPLAALPVEEYQSPLVRLFGSASSGGATSHWWLRLLLLLLLAAAAYVYSRWKKYLAEEREED